MKKITRQKLRIIVSAAATKAQLLASEKATLVAAVTDPEVTRIAAGTFMDATNQCLCPMSLVGQPMYDIDRDEFLGSSDAVSRYGRFVTFYDKFAAEEAGIGYATSMEIVG